MVSYAGLRWLNLAWNRLGAGGQSWRVARMLSMVLRDANPELFHLDLGYNKISPSDMQVSYGASAWPRHSAQNHVL